MARQNVFNSNAMEKITTGQVEELTVSNSSSGYKHQAQLLCNLKICTVQCNIIIQVKLLIPAPHPSHALWEAVGSKVKCCARDVSVSPKTEFVNYPASKESSLHQFSSSV